MSRCGYYYKSKCHICGQELTQAGAARVSHMRKHVREGLAVESVGWDGFLQFAKTNKTLRAEKGEKG